MRGPRLENANARLGLGVEKASGAARWLGWQAAFFPEVGISKRKHLCPATARVRQRCRLRPCIVATILAALPWRGSGG
jgi:hypothetical protein